METGAPQHMLTKEQKTGFILLLLFGVMSVVLGFIQLRNTVYNPFAIKKEETSHIVQFEDEATRLQKIDTDQDGINDYKELEFYQTSPYLPDTDSDGLSDKEEIDAGTDPLCPEGKTCGSLLPDQTSIVSEGLTNQIDKTTEASSLSAVVQGESGNEIIRALQESNPEIAALLSDPAQIRELLIASGNISKEEVDSFTDDELYQKVAEVLLTQTQTNTQAE